MQKVLVMGGTGAMGVYLVPELLQKGYQVDVLSLDQKESDHPALRYITGNGHDETIIKKLLQNRYDGIVDFLIYKTAAFRQRYEILLENTKHYIFLSSYRVYAGQWPIHEDSPQLLDVSDNQQYLSTEDYSLFKAREEDILEKSRFSNWTIVRPAITYSKLRYQLVTLEADVVINRARAGKTVLLPKEAKDVQATMSWAGDVAKMFTGLLFNENAKCQHYTLATAEHQTWGTIAKYYEELLGLKVEWVDEETYLQIIADSPDRYLPLKWQLEYDRLFERVVDNTKVLQTAGMKQEDLIPLKEGLRYELETLPVNAAWVDSTGINERMDAYFKNVHS